MRDNKNSVKRKLLYIGVFILLIGGISYGYAKLQTTLTINGKAKIEKTTWDIHFIEHNSTGYATEGSFDNDGKNVVTVTSSTTATYDITLNEPGQFYEFTLEIENKGTLDATLEQLTMTWPEVPDDQKEFITFTVLEKPSENSDLAVNEKVPVKIKAVYDYDKVNADKLPKTDIELTGSIQFDYVQKKK